MKKKILTLIVGCIAAMNLMACGTNVSGNIVNNTTVSNKIETETVEKGFTKSTDFFKTHYSNTSNHSKTEADSEIKGFKDKHKSEADNAKVSLMYQGHAIDAIKSDMKGFKEM